MIYILVFASFLLFFLCIEVFKRRYGIPTEISRKVIHIGSGLCALYWSTILNKFEFIAACSIFIILFIALRKKRLLKALYPDKWRTYGEITYVIGLVILALFYYDKMDIFFLGVLLLMIPDAMAGLTHIFISKSYREHSHILTYLLTSTIIVYFFLPPVSIVPLVLLLTLTEYYSAYGLDNVTVPVVFVLFMSLLF